jgi:hypothetical protein
VSPGKADGTELRLGTAEADCIPTGGRGKKLSKCRGRRLYNGAEQIFFFIKVRIKGTGCDIGVTTDHTEGRAFKAMCQKLLFAALEQSDLNFIILRQQLGHPSELNLTVLENITRKEQSQGKS